MNSLLFFPEREILATPAEAGLPFEDVAIETEDGERLHGWWVPARRGRAGAHVLLCHGNAGNVGDRVLHAALLCAAGLDVLLFDYRGYGRSSGRPGEAGTIVPLSHGQALFDAAPEPKQLHVIRGVGHNDLVTRAGPEWAAAIARFSAVLADGEAR